jgi:hypothetical protein
MRGTAHEYKRELPRVLDPLGIDIAKLATPGGRQESQTPTWRGHKGWDHPFDNSLSMDLNTGHRVGAARFFFGLGA